MDIRVESDGTLEGTQVLQAETGEPVEYVSEVRINIKPDSNQLWAELVIMCPITKLNMESSGKEFCSRIGASLDSDQLTASPH